MLGNQEEQTKGIKKQAQYLIDQAYQRGYKAGRESNIEQYDKAWSEQAKDYIEIGRNEAWYAAQKLVSAGYKECNEILGDGVLEIESVDDVFVRCTASEAIEKIKAYKERKKQDDEIKVGDEVRLVANREVAGIVTQIDYQNKVIWVMSKNGKHWIGASPNPETWEKTGRHFSQIAEVLEKMKEGDYN